MADTRTLASDVVNQVEQDRAVYFERVAVKVANSRRVPIQRVEWVIRSLLQQRVLSHDSEYRLVIDDSRTSRTIKSPQRAKA